MDDDFASAVFGLLFMIALIGAVLYGIYLFIVYVLPWILLVGISTGLPGWGLMRLLTTPRFQLTTRSAGALFFGIGLAAWLATTLVISNTFLHPAIALLLAPSCFYMGGLILVTVWGGYRWAVVWKQVAVIQRKEQTTRRVVENLQARTERLRAQITRIEARHGEKFQELDTIRKQTITLCAQEPRALGILYQEYREALPKMGEAELHQALKALKPAPTNPSNQLCSLLLRQEIISRSVNFPAQQFQQRKEDLAEAERDLQGAQQTLKRLKQEGERRREIYQAFIKKPILL